MSAATATVVSVGTAKSKPSQGSATNSTAAGKCQQQQQRQRSQYLHPDFLEAPSCLQSDPKQSPLALLVKTCDSIGSAGPADLPHLPPTGGPRSASRRSAGSRPPSAATAVDGGGAPQPVKRPGSPVSRGRDDRLGQPGPAKQRSPQSPPQPQPPQSGLGKAPESPTGLAASSASSAAIAAAMAAAAAAAAGGVPHHSHRQHHHPMDSGSPLSYPPVSMFPPFHQHQHLAASAAWGLGAVPEGHSAAVCACLHCVHARALVDYLYASAAAAAASAAASAGGPAATNTASTASSSSEQHPRRQQSPSQTPQAEFCIFCGRHCPTPEQLVRHMRSHESASAGGAAAPQLSPFSGPPSPPPPPPPQPPQMSAHHATLAYAAAAAAAMQQQQQQQPQQQQMESMRKWAAAAAAAASDQRYHPYRSLLGRLQFSHFGAAPLV